MRMPHPFSKKENIIQEHRHFGSLSVPINLIPESTLFEPFEIEKLRELEDKISGDHEVFVGRALEKIKDNHYKEHMRVAQEKCSVDYFKKSLELQSVSLWADGSWAMIFLSETGTLSNRSVCACFPTGRASFTCILP